MNTLEHVYNHQSFLNNISRCLNDGGRIEGVVPFLHHYHADPDDYFRYTHSALKRILANAGFEDIHITKLGKGGFTVSAGMISRILKFKPIVWIWWMNAIMLDFVLSKIWKTNRNIYGALAFSCKKRCPTYKLSGEWYDNQKKPSSNLRKLLHRTYRKS